jgi:hypothetical protein
MGLIRIVSLSVALASPLAAQVPPRWEVHDTLRPRPRVVDARGVPSDAVVLFDGRDLSEWRSARGGAAPWQLRDGFMEVAPGSGDIETARGFGDFQLHIEWATPAEVSGEGQGRGNSGVFLMGRYELQILDSHENRTYADGQAGAIYGQHPPLVNASRPPGQWQTYDIVFRRPRFDSTGVVLSPARMTVLHNGVLVQDNVELLGATAHQRRAAYTPHADRLPIKLQDHGNRTRFRNIWAREIEQP